MDLLLLILHNNNENNELNTYMTSININGIQVVGWWVGYRLGKGLRIRICTSWIELQFRTQCVQWGRKAQLDLLPLPVIWHTFLVEWDIHSFQTVWTSWEDINWGLRALQTGAPIVVVGTLQMKPVTVIGTADHGKSWGRSGRAQPMTSQELRL